MIKHEWIEHGTFWPGGLLYRCKLCGEVVSLWDHADKRQLNIDHPECKLNVIQQIDDV
jgi:hypothetical protein